MITVSVDSLRSVTDATHARLLLTDPRPSARTEGAQAWDAGRSRARNPYAVLTPEYASWDAGWWDRQKEHD